LKPKYRSIISSDCITSVVTQLFSLLPKLPLPAVDHIICVPPSVNVGPFVNLPSLIVPKRLEKVLPGGAVAQPLTTAFASSTNPGIGKIIINPTGNSKQYKQNVLEASITTGDPRVNLGVQTVYFDNDEIFEMI